MIDPSGRMRRTEEANAIYYDTVNGVAGQDYPIGTAQMPAQNWADLAAIVNQRGIHTVRLLSDITIGGAINDWNFIGDVGRTVTANGQVITACYFELCVLTGNLGAASSIYTLNCLIAASTVQELRAFNCEVDGVQIFTANPSFFYQCYGRGVTLDMTNDPTVYVYGGKGNWTVANLTAGGVAHIYMDSGVVTLAASCTGGTINIYGNCTMADASGGATVNDNRNNSYLEQVVPIKMNCTQSLNNTAANKDFIGSNLTGAVGLVSTDDTLVDKVFLLIIGRANNSYDGDNELDCATAAHNQWRTNLDGGAYSDLVNEEADGQMLDGDWESLGKGIIHPFTFMFDITSQLTNIDGKIGVRLENGRSDQANLVVICDIYLRVLWKL